MDVFQKNELKSHILSLATHTARAALFAENANYMDARGEIAESRRMQLKAQAETEYASNKQKYIWQLIDNLP